MTNRKFGMASISDTDEQTGRVILSVPQFSERARMKFTTTVAGVLAALSISTMAAPAPQLPSGSRNLVAAPASEGKLVGLTAAKPLLVRHPTQAGKVSRTVAGNFVPSAKHSWIAKGDKRYSLCATTNANKVACSPLLAASSMDDLEVGVIVGKNGEQFLIFKTAPTPKRHRKALAQSAGIFVQRLAKMSAHLERHTVSYSPRPWERSLRVSATESAVAGGDSCGGYDDFGAYECSGGDVGGGDSGDRGGDSGDWGSCTGQCDYPTGNDNGDPPSVPFDPITGEGIDPAVPVVIIVGQRPPQGTVEPPADWITNPPPMPSPEMVPIPTDVEPVQYIPAGCIPGPRGTFVCPPTSPNPILLPKPKPGFIWKWKWSDIQWCKLWNNCDPKANESNEPRPPAVTPEEKFLAAMDLCEAQAKAHMEYCVQMEKHRDDAQNRQCGYDAVENFKACEKTAYDTFKNSQRR